MDMRTEGKSVSHAHSTDNISLAESQDGDEMGSTASLNRLLLHSPTHIIIYIPVVIM